jgi:MtrB/PioB family decaheme-associated outer membrane protein
MWREVDKGYGADKMKIRARLFLGLMTSAFAVGGPAIPHAIAQLAPAGNVWASGAPAVDGWWFHGELEVGGRAFLNNPEKNGIASQGGKSLSKYYEYNDKKPGPFGNAYLSTGTNDGLYQFDLWGKNIGYEDQRFDVSASKAGEHYFNFQWDETPHNYGSGLTLYNGIGSTALTLPSGLSAALYGAAGGGGALPTSTNLTPTEAANIKKLIDANVHQTDIGIRRDTATVEYRWTPTEAWDVRVNYDRTQRTGTQVEGVIFTNNPSGVISQVPKPVNDTTQNFGLNGEYAGSSPWGQKFTFKLGYSGSVYQDGSSSYTVEDPFCLNSTTCGPAANKSGSTALMAMWPDNQANGFNATLGADLPMKSRYAGTVSYIMMRQNQAFLPFTDNPNLGNINGANPSTLAALPASSLNGAVNTFLSNNVLTTQITPDLKSKLSYRYYDFQNDTPELYFSNYVVADAQTATATNGAYAPLHSISVAYTKQNAAADLNYHPTQAWNFGATYGLERYDWTRADVDVTNENSGKLYADWKPWVWLTARASWLYGERRYENYSYLDNIGSFQWLGGTCPAGISCNLQQSSAMRQFYLNNRDRNKGQFSVSVDVIHGLTLTPTFAFQDDAYQVDPTEVGLTRNRSWVSGIDMAYVINPAVTLNLSFMNEQANQIIRSTSATSNGALTAANTYTSPVKDNINTFMAGGNFQAIPDKLDFDLRYTVSLSNSSQPVYYDDGQIPGGPGHQPGQGLQYPNARSTWQRLEAIAKYRFDKETVQQIGWKGDITAKLRYAWERNSVDNWQNDMMQTYMYTATAPGSSYGYANWLAYDNPNYNVQLIMASLAFKW